MLSGLDVLARRLGLAFTADLLIAFGGLAALVAFSYRKQVRQVGSMNSRIQPCQLAFFFASSCIA